MGGLFFIVCVVVVAVIVLMMFDNSCEEASKRSEEAAKQRKASLLSKYGDSELVEKLLQGYFWQGQTEEQLRDSIGAPSDIDQKILKTKKKEVWKYGPTGRNRYGLRITVENGVVVGWDKK